MSEVHPGLPVVDLQRNMFWAINMLDSSVEPLPQSGPSDDRSYLPSGTSIEWDATRRDTPSSTVLELGIVAAGGEVRCPLVAYVARKQHWSGLYCAHAAMPVAHPQLFGRGMRLDWMNRQLRPDDLRLVAGLARHSGSTLPEDNMQVPLGILATAEGASAALNARARHTGLLGLAAQALGSLRVIAKTGY